MIYQPSFQVVTLHLTFSSTGCEPAETQTLLDNDLQLYAHVFFTSPDTWDVSVLDHDISPSLLEEINQDNDASLLQDSMFDDYGELQHRAIQKLNIFWDPYPTESGEHTFHTQLHESKHAKEDWKSLRPYFGW